MKNQTKKIRTDHLTVSDRLDEVDAKMMYQAYRLGMLPWESAPNMAADDFVESAGSFILENYDLNWSIRKDKQTLCILFAKDNSRFMLMGDAIWWPKTGPKEKLQSMAAVFNEIRKDRVAIFEAEYKYKKFYEALVNRKILRRVGSIYDTIEKGSRTTFFQTRA